MNLNLNLLPIQGRCFSYFLKRCTTDKFKRRGPHRSPMINSIFKDNERERENDNSWCILIEKNLNSIYLHIFHIDCFLVARIKER